MEKFNLRCGLLLGVILASLFCGSYAVVDSTPPIQQLPDLSACRLPAETGPCRARFLRYHFDISTGQCNLFVYGGCQGNANNFETLGECQFFGSRCLRLPASPAPLPTRKPMSDHEPLDLRWVGKYPVIPQSSVKPGSG